MPAFGSSLPLQPTVRPNPASPGLSPWGPRPYSGSPLGPMSGESLYDPNTGAQSRTGAQRGTNAGQAFKALAESSGLPLLSMFSESGAGGAGGGATVPQVSMPDTSAASAAAFGRAKDQAGQTARASLTALHNELASRNMLGSGVEGGETARIIGRAAGGANEMTREQAIQDAQAGMSRASQEYQGRIAQRGQDIDAAQAAASRRQQSLQGLLSVINSSGLLY